MPPRLSKIVTRTGDDGTTGLANGQRVAKESARIEAGGSVDELNCTIGVLLAAKGLAAPLKHCLLEVQQELFDLGGELAIPGASVLTTEHVLRLEAQVKAANAALPPLREFVLPGGGAAAAACHVARAVCRRAERRCWSLARVEEIAPDALKYLNRLSDLLFVIARVLAREESGSEVLWRHRR